MPNLLRSIVPALLLAASAPVAFAQPKPAPKPPEKTTLPPGEPAEGQPVPAQPPKPTPEPDKKPEDAKPVNPFGDFRPVIVPARGPFRAPDGSAGPHERVSQDSLMAFLAALPTKRAAWGSPDHLEGLKKTEDLLLEKLRAMGHEPRTQSFKWARVQGRPDPSRAAAKEGEAVDPPVEWRNIIVELPGTDLPNEVLLYGAHFDAVPNSPGADDNGTGTAGLLELARVLKGLPTRRTVRLVFFNVEEPGIIGATSYYNSIRAKVQTETPSDQFPLEPGKEHLVGMVSLEMLGYYSERPGSQKSPIRNVPGVIEQPDRGTFIALTTTQR
ncbi:MAG: M28 family peptidase, partial [Planctomycetota bacterium]|nr:M28 family peptidase [Planctomycetota bacterium]